MAADELGEFERIRRFFAPLAGPGGLGLVDDAALVDCTPGRRLVITADAIVAGVHYLPEDPPDLVARKLLRVNLSDLAAMGARPLHYVLTTALPAELGQDTGDGDRADAVGLDEPARGRQPLAGPQPGGLAAEPLLEPVGAGIVVYEE